MIYIYSIVALLSCSCSLMTPAIVEEVEEDTAEYLEAETVKVIGQDQAQKAVIKQPAPAAPSPVPPLKNTEKSAPASP